MTTQGIGDLSQSFFNNRNTTSIKTKLYTLSNELNTGRVQDLSSYLGGQNTIIDGLDRDLTLLDRFELSNQRFANSLGRMQISFEAVNAKTSQMIEQFAIVTPASLDVEFENASAQARQEFSAIVTQLNARDGDNALLAGNAVDANPLADGETMLADIIATVGGATDTASIVTAVENWFDAPGGRFETIGYLGDTGDPLTRRIGPDDTVAVSARADDPSIRAVLKGVAIAAVAEAVATPLTNIVKADLMRTSAERLLTANADFVGLQAEVGQLQERITMAQATQSAQKSAYTLARNDLTLADPFETATRLQDVQRQLEMQFTTTARLSQLSLANYL